MASRIARRKLLQLSLASAVCPAALGASAAAPAKRKAQPKPQAKPQPTGEGLTAYQDGPQIWVRWNNAQLAGYRAHPTQKYPYFFPLRGPVTGLSVTTESSLPWPHHRSMLFACDRVNDGNYWQGTVEQGQIISTQAKLGESTPQSVEILDRCEWRKPGQAAVMADERRFTLRIAKPTLWFLDAALRWTAIEDITVQKTNHSLFSVRAAGDLTPLGGGALVNSEGASGEKGTFGKPAGWCAYYGKRPATSGEVVEGIALLDHPANPWKNCPWFTRDYGFISPTPFNFLDKPWELAKGKSLDLRYRVAVFAGTPEEVGLAEIFREWAAS